MKTNNKVKISEIDLDAIKMKLMHRESGEGWSILRADTVEQEYRRFLILMKKFPGEAASPTVDVDTFWHYHILDTMKYAADCELMFGYFLHHYPYVGLSGDSDGQVRQRAGERMRQLYEQTFGMSEATAVGIAASAYCGAATSNVAYCGAATGAATSAYCGAVADRAYCGATVGAPVSTVANNYAYCGAVAKTAYCGAVAKIAYCGATRSAVVQESRTDNSYCGAVAQVAYCGAVAEIASRGKGNEATPALAA
jgi:hypothetical protein